VLGSVTKPKQNRQLVDWWLLFCHRVDQTSNRFHLPGANLTIANNNVSKRICSTKKYPPFSNTPFYKKAVDVAVNAVLAIASASGTEDPGFESHRVC
jgi:hypothetical protein